MSNNVDWNKAADAQFTAEDMGFMTGGSTPPTAPNAGVPQGPQQPAQQAQQQPAMNQQAASETEQAEAPSQGGLGGMFSVSGNESESDPTKDPNDPNFQPDFTEAQEPSQSLSPQGSENLGEGERAPVGEEFSGDEHEYPVDAEDPYDVRNYIPVEQLNDEFIFNLDEQAKYRDWDSLVKGTQERLRYLAQVQEENSQLREAIQTERQELAAVQAEASTMTGLITGGMSEEEVEILMARQYLSEELRGLTPSDFEVTLSSSLPDWNTFLSDYQKRNTVDPSEYDEDIDYKRALWQNEEKARQSYAAKRDRLEKEQGAQRGTKDQLRIQFEEAMATARAKVRTERESQKNRARSIQQQFAQSLNAAELRLQGVMKSNDRLGIENKEDEFKAANLLQQSTPVVVNGEPTDRLLSEVIVLVEANYGSVVSELILDGLKLQLGNVGRSAATPPRPNRPRPISSLPSGRRPPPRRRRASARPVEEMDFGTMARDAGFVAQAPQR